MDTVKIVCPHCAELNSIKNEVKPTDVSCSSCKGSLLETTPVICDSEMFKRHICENEIAVLVDFYSPACAPCMKMAPDFDETASKFALEVRFIKVNTQDHPEIARQYGVNELPTLIAFKKGRELNRFSSALSKDHLKMWSESLIQMVI